MTKHLALGLMSGTSADGLSLALGEFQERKFRLVDYRTVAYPSLLSKRITGALELKTAELSLLNFELGRFFAAQTAHFLETTKIPANKVRVIGSHGQTVYHGPNDHPANTLQIGEASLIAEKTGIPVVADFRPRDMAAGGEGAPLMPFFDDYFFSEDYGRALQNIGGIANVTFVKKGEIPVAFDNGPGNTLLDAAMRRISGGTKTFDRNGQLARQGSVLKPYLAGLQNHPYFRKEPPKSTGKELFGESFLPAEIWNEKPEDILATLTFFSAWSIAESYRSFAPFRIKEVIVSGGGALNPVLMQHLHDFLYPMTVGCIDTWNIPAQAKEPLAFAFFALCALQGKPNHLPVATGAAHPCILGKVIPVLKTPTSRKKNKAQSSQKTSHAVR